MLDLHPVTEERVESEGRVLGVLEEPEFVADLLPNAEARLDEAVRAGLYVLEEELELDILQHFDRAEDLLEAKQNCLAAQPALARLIRAASPPFVNREHVVFRRFRVLRPAGIGRSPGLS